MYLAQKGHSQKFHCCCYTQNPLKTKLRWLQLTTSKERIEGLQEFGTVSFSLIQSVSEISWSKVKTKIYHL